MPANVDLINAVKAGKLDDASRAIKEGADNVNDALLHACATKSAEMVRLLIEHGADNLNDAAIESVAHKNLAYLPIFYEHGFTDFNSAVKHASITHNIPIELLRFIADEKHELDYILAFSAKIGNVRMMEHAKDEGAQNFNLAYAWASEAGKVDACKLLVSWGADDFNWGLHAAARVGAYETMMYAYDRGASDHDTALKLACENKHTHLIRPIIKKGAQNIFIALEAAIKVGSAALVKLCLEVARDPKVKAEINSLIENAKREGVHHIVRLLEEFARK